MYREQPTLAFLYEEIDAINRIKRAEIFATIQQIGTVTPQEAANLRVPTMFLVGEEDIVIPPPFLEAAAALIPNTRITRIPNAGHSTYFERPQEFNAAIEAFLAQ